MSKPRKYYLADYMQDMSPRYRSMFKVGKTIVFEMPPFCSGDYTAKIYKDELGLYILDEDNFFEGCRYWRVK